MKQTKHFLALLVLLAGTNYVHAQNWLTTGNSGLTNSNFLGTTDNQDLIFKANNIERGRLLNTTGAWRFGTTGNNAQIDNTGKLTFSGTGVYQVGGNKYAFQYSGNPNYGLYFNLTNVRYEFRNGSAVPVFFVNANNGNSYFSGNLGVGVQNPTSKLDVNGDINMSTGSVFRMNGIQVLSDNAANQNLFVGDKAGITNTTGIRNTANGSAALHFNTTGDDNTAIGALALYVNTTGFENTATGYSALYFNTTGFYNTANGANALYSNINGSFNTANGTDALHYNTTGSFNTADGYGALIFNTTGNYNTANGTDALHYNSTGFENIANGTRALYANTIGNDNTANGYSALYSNTTGSYNTANGSYALYLNTTGNYNIANGYNVLVSNTTGFSNTATGNFVLDQNTTGFSNTAYGYAALGSNKTGNSITALGYSADANGSNFSNTTILGAFTFGTASDQVRIGNFNVTSIGGYADWTNISDGRVKKNIKENVPGLEFINQLKPVTYNLDLDKADNIIQRPVIKDTSRNNGMDKSKMLQEQNASRKAKMQIVYTGFIAQDVEKVAKSMNYDFSGVDAPKNDKDLYGLRYAEFVVPLVKAVQELSKANDDKDAKIDNLQKQLNDLKNLVLSMQQSSTNGFSQTPSKQIALSSASLEQNIPNPFSNVTSISYNLPTQISSAKIIVTDKTGKTLKEISLNGGGKGTIQIDASTLSGGAYQYALYVNNKLIDTKQMVSIK